MNGVDCGINVNVAIRHVNKDTGEIKEWEGHNIATRTMVLGIYKYLRGDFAKNDTEDDMYDYFPQFLILGAGNTPATYDDTVLETPLNKDGDKDDTPPYTTGSQVWRFEVGSSGYSDSTRTITLPLRFYVGSNELAGTTAKPTEIWEVGLISKNGNLCARYVIKPEDNPPILKAENDFIDVLWEISITAIQPAS